MEPDIQSCQSSRSRERVRLNMGCVSGVLATAFGMGVIADRVSRAIFEEPEEPKIVVVPEIVLRDRISADDAQGLVVMFMIDNLRDSMETESTLLASHNKWNYETDEATISKALLDKLQGLSETKAIKHYFPNIEITYDTVVTKGVGLLQATPLKSITAFAHIGLKGAPKDPKNKGIPVASVHFFKQTTPKPLPPQPPAQKLKRPLDPLKCA